MISTGSEEEKAYLVAVSSGEDNGLGDTEGSIAELAQLTSSAGASVVGSLIQHLPSPSKVFYIGKGKVEDLRLQRDETGYNLVIFDDELTPSQQYNLEEALGVRVIDRVTLILDVFARHARTSEGKLQIELAQYKYLLPRLAGRWSHLERLGGGIGTRGPGESQLESDRRLIKQKVQRLEKKLEDIRKHRSLYYERRRKAGIPIVSLVGYTNAGKSTLFNALSEAGVLVADKLFATLDPTTRRVALPDGKSILLTDTVGFIKKLPPAIISAFRATLEELDEADLFIHVVDLSAVNASEQFQVVENILCELGLADKPRITALNKVDLLTGSLNMGRDDLTLEPLLPCPDGKTVLVSARKGWGIRELIDTIARVISGANIEGREGCLGNKECS